MYKLVQVKEAVGETEVESRYPLESLEEIHRQKIPSFVEEGGFTEISFDREVRQGEKGREGGKEDRE